MEKRTREAREAYSREQAIAGSLERRVKRVQGLVKANGEREGRERDRLADDAEVAREAGKSLPMIKDKLAQAVSLRMPSFGGG